jgi:hypothetical protein
MKTVFLFVTGLLLCTIGFSQNVGIGTTAPLARLHVTDSSVVFTAAGTASATPGNPPISSGGRRMMWYADKAAFRAGYVSDVNWNKDSIGNYSVSLGNNNKALGIASVALGVSTTASGNYSTAMGYSTTASGNYSTAMGYSTTASGWYSAAMGFQTHASGNYSTAMGGSSTTASGEVSFAMGFNANASGFLSTAIGTNAIASGPYSIAMGFGTTASGQISTAMGTYSQANAISSFAIGESVAANSLNSISLGIWNDPIVTSPTYTWVPTEPLLVVGNGTSSTDKKNALVILKNGNVGIGGSNDPDAPLTLASGFGKRINLFTGGSGHIGMSVQPGTNKIL